MKAAALKLILYKVNLVETRLLIKFINILNIFVLIINIRIEFINYMRRVAII